MARSCASGLAVQLAFNGARNRQENVMNSKVAPVRHDYAALGTVNCTRELARFVVATDFAGLPAPVVSQTRRLITDCLGVALGASGEPDLQILLDYASTVGGAEQAAVWGSDQRVSVLHAAMINGQLSAILDMDDTYLSDLAAFHGSGQVIPPALAVAEWKGASGAEFLAAVAAGYEVSMRVMLSAGITHHRQRWYTVSTAGPFGAAAAAGKLLGLNEQQMVYALGIAGVHAAGLIEPLGSMTGAFQYARSGMAGITAALLAQRGFTSAQDILTGKFGFHAVFHSDQNLDRLAGELGSRWSLLETGFKPFACGINMHALLSGVISLREEFTLRGEEVEEINLRVNPHVLVPTGLKEPKVGREGKFSVYHSAAVALIDGDCGPAQYTDARVADPTVVALRQRVNVIPDDDVRRDEAHVAITTRSGLRHERHVGHAPGTILNPLDNEALVAKCKRFALPVLGRERTEELLRMVDRLERVADAGDLARLLAVKG